MEGTGREAVLKFVSGGKSSSGGEVNKLCEVGDVGLSEEGVLHRLHLIEVEISCISPLPPLCLYSLSSLSSLFIVPTKFLACPRCQLLLALRGGPQLTV